MFGLLLLFLLAVPAGALTVDQAAVGAAADESACALSRPGERFASTHDQVYFRFVARRIRAGERLTVEWIDPQGQTHTSAGYDPLPAASSLCFLTGLPLGGFPAAQMPGVWTVRVLVDKRVAVGRTFEVTGVVDSTGPRVTGIDRTEVEGKQTEIEIRGAGFLSDSVVNIAQYAKEGGWSYIAVLLPAGTTDGRMIVRLPALPPAEYLVIVKNPDGGESLPARFLVASPADYKLPTPEGVPWTITQGPYGGFSHYGRSRHAWDIAPRAGACLVAMRAGTAFTFDLRLGQTPGRRIFGNYITVQHGDGEFSHYGHLQTGTFRVTNGQRVEQGQPLATAGNSGYTVGQGGGHHVHVHVTNAFSISSPSIPFRFGDLPGHAARVKYVTVSSTNRVEGDCDTATNRESYTGSVAVTEVWSQVVTVAKETRALDVRLEGGTREASLDLSLVSPSGRHHATYAEAGGFDGGGARFRAADPEPGLWRVLVRGIRGGGERVAFRVTVEAAAPRHSSGRALPAARR